MSISRRAFIRLAGTTVACTCLGGLGTTGCAGERAAGAPLAPAGSYRVDGDQVIVALAEVETLKPVGGTVQFSLHGEDGSERKVIVVHAGDEDYRAFANWCTHKAKELTYLHEEQKLACVGLGSQFDLAGGVLRGPAGDALLRYRLRRNSGELVIELQGSPART